jgi:hypothetical protein
MQEYFRNARRKSAHPLLLVDQFASVVIALLAVAALITWTTAT